ncbi:MAG: Rieske 2Fe-2S domain-containing protein [Candidatus Bathyarchaeia archaeon]
MTTHDDANQISERIVVKYGMHVSKETAASIFRDHPKVPVLLSRASFRPDVDVRTEQRTRFQRERRNFLHGMLGFAAFSISALLLLKIASSNSQPQTPVNVSNPVAPTSRLLANATNIPPNQSMTINDPTFGPVLLIHLDNGQFVAYSPICTHAGCQVQFDPSAKDIACPCHGAVFDPYHNAQVLGGPAPYPLQAISIQYDSSSGNVYVTG